MYFIYLLFQNNNQIYTGFTADLKLRIKQHEVGKVASTRAKRPLRLLGYEAFMLESDARRREKFLKTTEGKRLRDQQYRDIITAFRSSPDK